MSMKQTMCEFVHGMTCEEVSRFVGSIVRCRDCVYMTNQKYKSYEYQTCSYFDSEYAEVEPDGFCKWGERRA